MSPGQPLTRAVVMRERPLGAPTPENFEIVDRPVVEPTDDEVVVETIYLSVIPSLRRRLDPESYLGPGLQPGDCLQGPAIGRVAASRHPGFAEGDIVNGFWDWRELVTVSGKALRRIETGGAPLILWGTVLGNSSFAAWIGMKQIGRPKAGETVVVSAASGGVGAIAGQLARRAGARVVGIAGGPAKCDYVVRRLGYDACLDHRAPDLPGRLREAAPKGIDLDFENVGGPVFDAVYHQMNRFGRVVLCGMIAEYNGEAPVRPPSFWETLARELTVTGFLAGTYRRLTPAFLEEMTPLAISGEIHQPSHVGDGLESAPQTFVDMLSGRAFGKCLVRVRPEP